MTKASFQEAGSVRAPSPDSDSKTINDLADTLTDLAGIAQGHDLSFLAYLIDMAATEARAQTIREASGDG